MKDFTCCFTGHRPKNLPWGFNEKSKVFKKNKNILIKKIENAISNGYKLFISGMALGIDIVSDEIILKLKKKHTHIKLECAIPCLNQTSSWKDERFLKRYNNILSQADFITYVSKTNYFNGCMQKRNKYMIDKSNLLIACFNGTYGGTFQTISYARKNNLEVIIISL